MSARILAKLSSATTAPSSAMTNILSRNCGTYRNISRRSVSCFIVPDSSLGDGGDQFGIACPVECHYTWTTVKIEGLALRRGKRKYWLEGLQHKEELWRRTSLSSVRVQRDGLRQFIRRGRT